MIRPIRLLIADDETAPREQLAEALGHAWPEAQIVAQAEHGADAWDAWLEHEPDAVFLDIRMPGLTGIEVAQRIAGRCPVVFVTAYGDHALSAFDAGAVDYLVKPVDPQRLVQAVARVRERLQHPPVAGEADALQALLGRLAEEQRRPPRISTVQASVGKEVRLIRLDDVVFFESDTRYTRVVFQSDGHDGEALLRIPLKELVTQLDERQFIQVHRSVIVAERHIQSAVRTDDGKMFLKLRGRGETLPVSRPFHGLFKGQ
ncbi:MAG: response regulator transcription factor [Rhodoferax sp.]|nr:response regulator transcription factor [Rhodoferax sp.]